MTPAERAQLLRRWTARLGLPGDATLAATAARRLLGACRLVDVAVPWDVEGAAEVLEGAARAIGQEVARARAPQRRSGMDEAAYQRHLERRTRRPAPGRPATRAQQEVVPNDD